MGITDHAQIAAAQLDDGAPVSELIARYRAGASLLRDAIADLTRVQLLAHPVPGKMSAQEVVSHVADCDQFLADRMKRTIAMDRPLLVGADGWLYPEALHYAERDVALDLALVGRDARAARRRPRTTRPSSLGAHGDPHRDRTRHAPAAAPAHRPAPRSTTCKRSRRNGRHSARSRRPSAPLLRRDVLDLEGERREAAVVPLLVEPSGCPVLSRLVLPGARRAPAGLAAAPRGPRQRASCPGAPRSCTGVRTPRWCTPLPARWSRTRAGCAR